MDKSEKYFKVLFISYSITEGKQTLFFMSVLAELRKRNLRFLSNKQGKVTLKPCKFFVIILKKVCILESA